MAVEWTRVTVVEMMGLSESRCILKAELSTFADGLDVKHEKGFRQR